MRRRAFLGALGGAAIWPLSLQAQSDDRIRRFGILMSTAEEPVALSRVAALRQALANLGWVADRNLAIELRWGNSDVARIREAIAATAHDTGVTVNPGLIEHLLAFAQREAIPRERFQLQMLYGVRPKLQLELAARGYPVLVATPYGPVSRSSGSSGLSPACQRQ